MSMEKLGAFVGGALFATVGAKILASKDAQKVYVYTTAAALREKEDVMSVVTNIKEIAGDVLAGAKAFNEKRAAEQVFNATHTLNEETRDLMLKSGIPSYMDEAIESRRTIDPAVKDLQNRLLSGKITWGEYNRERRDLAVRSAESHHE